MAEKRGWGAKVVQLSSGELMISEHTLKFYKEMEALWSVCPIQLHQPLILRVTVQFGHEPRR